MRHLNRHPFLTDWRRLDYLADGNSRQRSARLALLTLDLYRKLSRYQPVLAGTIPIGCDLPGSDLDILCQSADLDAFKKICERLWFHKADFRSRKKKLRGGQAAIVSFSHWGFEIEIAAQRRPVAEQYAFAHMLAEAHLLHSRGTINRFAVRKLKQGGLSTEEAFSSHFGLAGDPYEHLFKLYMHQKKRHGASAKLDWS